MNTFLINIKYTRLLALPTAFLYALILITLIPIDVIIDRDNYLDYADNSGLILLSYFDSGLHVILFNEPIFLFINLFLSFLFTSENVVRSIIFFSAFTTSFLVLRYNFRYFFILFLFLLIPQVLKNYVIHLRQGLAVSFFLIGYLSTNKKTFKSIFFIFISPFVHSSFFVLIIFIYGIKFLTQLKFDYNLKVAIISLFGLLSSMIMETVGKLVGARQVVEYQFTIENISGIGFLFWLFILFIFSIQGKEFLKSNLFSIAILIFYLTTYFFIPVTARIFESGIILVLLSGLNLTYWRKYTFIGLIIFFAAFTYILNLGSPYLGWGVN